MSFSPITPHSGPNISHRRTEQPADASSINKHGHERSRDFFLPRLQHHRPTGSHVPTVLRVQLSDPDRISRPIGLRRRLQRLRLFERPQRRLGRSHRLRRNSLQVQHQCLCCHGDQPLRELLPESLWDGKLFAGLCRRVLRRGIEQRSGGD